MMFDAVYSDDERREYEMRLILMATRLDLKSTTWSLSFGFNLAIQRQLLSLQLTHLFCSQ